MATEAAGHLVHDALKNYCLETIMAVTLDENTAFEQVLQKIGMQLVHRSDSRDGNNLLYYRISVPDLHILQQGGVA